MIAGGGQPPLSPSDPYPVFTTPAVGSAGAVHFTWCNYGTATTLGPLSCRVRSTAANGGAFGAAHDILDVYRAGAMLPHHRAILRIATEHVPTHSIPVIFLEQKTSTNKINFTIA